jgi:hypothetical protein
MYMNSTNTKLRWHTLPKTNHELLKNVYDQYAEDYSKQAIATLIIHRYGLKFDYTMLQLEITQRTPKYELLEHLFLFLEAQLARGKKR